MFHNGRGDERNVVAPITKRTTLIDPFPQGWARCATSCHVDLWTQSFSHPWYCWFHCRVYLHPSSTLFHPPLTLHLIIRRHGWVVVVIFSDKTCIFCFLWWQWAPNITTDLNVTLCCCWSGVVACVVPIWPAARLGTMVMITMKNICLRWQCRRCQYPDTTESGHRPRRFGRIGIGLRRLERHGRCIACCRGGR